MKWRVINFLADESDPEFIVWNMLAKGADGLVQGVRVKVDRYSVAEHRGPLEGSASKWAQVVIQSQGKWLIELTEVDCRWPTSLEWVDSLPSGNDSLRELANHRIRPLC